MIATETENHAGRDFPSLEVHIPISANRLFVNMVHYFVRSLRRNGGRYASAPVILTVGEREIDNELPAKIPWMESLGVEIRWVPEDLYASRTFYATAVERFRATFISDIVLVLDADVIVSSSFETMVQSVYDAKACGGFIAHVSPFPDSNYWQRLYDHCGLGKVDLSMEHTAWGYMSSNPNQRYCPPYFNLGVLCAPADIMSQIGEVAYNFMDKSDQVFSTWFRCQIAVSLAVKAISAPVIPLGARYNLPNDIRFEALYPAEASSASIIHVLGNDPEPFKQNVCKTQIFDTFEQMSLFLERPDLRGINLTLQNTLRSVHTDVLRDPRDWFADHESFSGVMPISPPMNEVTPPAPAPIRPALQRALCRIARATRVLLGKA